MPDALILCGIQNAKPLRKSIENKLLYTGKMKNDEVKKLYMSSIDDNKAKAKMKGPWVECSFSVSTPGEYDENCGETCSEESLLGGDTWFCVCIYDCRAGWD